MIRPRPVLTSAGITGLIQGLGLILGFLGYTHQETNLSTYSQVLVSIVLGAVTVGGGLLHGLHAQAKVTPLANPVTETGVPLVPVTAAQSVVVAAAPSPLFERSSQTEIRPVVITAATDSVTTSMADVIATAQTTPAAP